MNALTRHAVWAIGVVGVLATACFGVYLAAGQDAPAPPEAPASPESPAAPAPTPKAEEPSPEATASTNAPSEKEIAPQTAERAPTNPAPNFTPPVASVLRLVEAGIEPEVIKGYVGNVIIPFYLPADHLIALRQRGVPDEVLVAMLGRNQELRAQFAQRAAALMPAQPAPQAAAPAQEVPAYDPAMQAAYAPPPSYSAPPYNYNYWWYSSAYPAFPLVFFPAFHHHLKNHPKHHPQLAAHVPFKQPHWSQAYPTRLITGPNWGADRRVAPRQTLWVGATPNRLNAGPTWGASRTLAPSPSIPPRATMGGFQRTGVASSFRGGRR